MSLEWHLRRVLVFAPDLRMAQAFYGDILGLRLQRTQDGIMRFRGVNFELDVFACESSSESSGYSQRAGSAVAFSVPSIKDAMTELRSKGVIFLHENPKEAPDGTQYVAFADPFGTVFELIETGDDRDSS